MRIEQDVNEKLLGDWRGNTETDRKAYVETLCISVSR